MGMGTKGLGAFLSGMGQGISDRLEKDYERQQTEKVANRRMLTQLILGDLEQNADIMTPDELKTRTDALDKITGSKAGTHATYFGAGTQIHNYMQSQLPSSQTPSQAAKAGGEAVDTVGMIGAEDENYGEDTSPSPTPATSSASEVFSPVPGGGVDYSLPVSQRKVDLSSRRKLTSDLAEMKAKQPLAIQQAVQIEQAKHQNAINMVNQQIKAMRARGVSVSSSDEERMIAKATTGLDLLPSRGTYSAPDQYQDSQGVIHTVQRHNMTGQWVEVTDQGSTPMEGLPADWKLLPKPKYFQTDQGGAAGVVSAGGGTPTFTAATDASGKPVVSVANRLKQLDLSSVYGPQQLEWLKQYAVSGAPFSQFIGRGAAGRANAAHLLGSLAKDVDAGTMSANQIARVADSASLSKMRSMADNVEAFSQTAGKNLDQFLKVVEKIPDTNVQALNYWVRKVAEQTGQEVTDAQAAARVAINEIGRVINTANLNGILSDHARQEVESLLKTGTMTIPQMKSIARILKTDIANRKGSNEDTLKEIWGRTAGRGKGKPAAERLTNPPSTLRQALEDKYFGTGVK